MLENIFKCLHNLYCRQLEVEDTKNLFNSRAEQKHWNKLLPKNFDKYLSLVHFANVPCCSCILLQGVNN